MAPTTQDPQPSPAWQQVAELIVADLLAEKPVQLSLFDASEEEVVVHR